MLVFRIALLLSFSQQLVQGTAKESLFCPEGCLCPREEEVICKDVDMDQIPQEMSANLRNLSIVRASIEQIGADDFRFYRNLERLSLSHCGLQRIEENTFANLPRLQYLTLLYNPLSELGSYALAGLKSLKEVIIRADALHRIPAYAFHGSEDIRVLDLRSHSVRLVEAEAFSGLQNVQFLHLPLNVSTIEPNAFNNLSRVHFLDIRHWMASSDSSFGGVRTRTFAGLQHVSYIRIDQSSLGTVHSGAFDHLETVKTMQIVHSRIGSVRSGAFSGMRNIGKLELLNNVIDHLARDSFRNTPGDDVYTLNMMDNELDCSCRNGWLVYNYVQIDNNTLRRNYCSAPESLAGKALKSLSNEYLADCVRTYAYHYLDRESSGQAMVRASLLTLLLMPIVRALF